LDNGRSKAIEGYCNANSLRVGEKLKNYGQCQSGIRFQVGYLSYWLLWRNRGKTDEEF
jgi:hypothetical protein